MPALFIVGGFFHSTDHNSDALCILLCLVEEQTSADRLPAVEATCLTWGGAIVVAVHVRLQSEFASVYEVVKQLHARVEEQSGCRLDIQFVTEDGFETDKEALNALYPVRSETHSFCADPALLAVLRSSFQSRPYYFVTSDG